MKRREYNREENEDTKRFRKIVKLRDKNTCQLCSYRGRKIEVHHVIKHSSSILLRTDPENGICLCKSCHKSISGREEFYAPLFNEIIQSKNKRK